MHVADLRLCLSSSELNLSFGERYSFLHDTSARANSVLTPTAVPHEGSYVQSPSCSLLLDGTLWALVEEGIPAYAGDHRTRPIERNACGTIGRACNDCAVIPGRHWLRLALRSCRALPHMRYPV